MKNTKVQELAKKIAKANNIEMDKALEIAKKALNIKEETKANGSLKNNFLETKKLLEKSQLHLSKL